jgi:hypothetical protein
LISLSKKSNVDLVQQLCIKSAALAVHEGIILFLKKISTNAKGRASDFILEFLRGRIQSKETKKEKL